MSPDLWQVLMISKLPWWWDPRGQDVGKDIWTIQKQFSLYYGCVFLHALLPCSAFKCALKNSSYEELMIKL